MSVQSSTPMSKFSTQVLAHQSGNVFTYKFGRLAILKSNQAIARGSALSYRRQSGQGMTEYIIIVALVAVAAIAVYQYLGQVLRAQTAAVAKELAGEDGTQQSRAAQSAAESAATQAAAKSLKDFTGHAQGAAR